MRLILAMLLAGLAALPLSVSAQDADGAATSQHKPEESTTSDEPVSDEGTLSPRVRKRTRQQWDPDTYKLRLDSSGLNLSRPPAPETTPSPMGPCSIAARVLSDVGSFEVRLPLSAR